MLEIKDLKVRVSGKDILKGIDLSVRPGEVPEAARRPSLRCSPVG